jgi:3D (Asp-Asp-Asp) domain-containing protein
MAGSMAAGLERSAVAILVGVLLAGGSGCAPFRGRGTAPARGAMDFSATAYCLTGTTAMGVETRPGIVAADPRILPLGTRIRVTNAGAYSGIYTVADTGPAVKGREIDIFIPDLAAAKRFGRRRVKVEVLDRPP